MAHQLVLTGTPRWAPLVTTGPAPVVPRQPLVYDPGGDRLLVFGGNFGDATLALELDPVGTVSTPAPPTATIFAMRRVAPNPARLSFTVSFELPRHGAVTLDLIDVAGRHVTGRTLEALPAGRHDVALGVPAFASPGVYFIRLAFEGSAIRSKVALIR
jgi:hypothetical protein